MKDIRIGINPIKCFPIFGKDLFISSEVMLNLERYSKYLRAVSHANEHPICNNKK